MLPFFLRRNMEQKTFTNVIIENLEIDIIPTDVLGDTVTLKVEFKPNDWGEIVPNITCYAKTLTINGEKYPFEENKKEKKEKKIDGKKSKKGD